MLETRKPELYSNTEYCTIKQATHREREKCGIAISSIK